MYRKLLVAVLYGGKSVEHVVSCRSAVTICKHLVAHNHTVIPIGIDREGRWSLQEEDIWQSEACLPSTFREKGEIVVLPGRGLKLTTQKNFLPLDIAFPVTHGSGGEDGLLQSLLELAEIPYVGSNPTASAIGMHKHLAKIIVQQAGISTLPSVLCALRDMQQWRDDTDPQFLLFFQTVIKKLGQSIIVKPEDGGSSVGVSALTASSPQGLWNALQSALQYTQLVLLEPFLEEVQEIECAVVCSDGTMTASTPGLVINPERQENPFLTYEQKYLALHQAYLQVPAPIPEHVLVEISQQAKVVAEVVGVSGYARVDFFREPKTGAIWFNEINTLPGMTDKSHFPALAETMGFTWGSLISTLLEEGFIAYGARTSRQVYALE